MKGIYTSESVGSGQPDKLCDVIADAILDACLEQDENSRVACEILVKNENVILSGEITTKAKIDYDKVVADTIRKIGYTYVPKVTNLITNQSGDVALGVNSGGAGDQGVMIGYACDETDELFPLAHSIAHALIRRVQLMAPTLEFTKPDMKSQVTVDYHTYDKPYIKTVVLSVQTIPGVNMLVAKELMYEKIVKPVLAKYKNIVHDKEIEEFLFNTTGKFEFGGPMADAGVTGRKQVVDSYGIYAPIGGGALCGKDATKVDRSAAYMCRWIAKNIVASGILKECIVQVSYAIGLKRALSFDIISTDDVSVDFMMKLEEYVLTLIDLKPRAIIEKFGLRRPLYSKWSDVGSFGLSNKNGVDVPWELIDLEFVEKLRNFKKEYKA